jgi:hypothetical protein
VVECGGCVASVGLLCLVMSCVWRVRVMYLLLSINGMIRRSPACSRKKSDKCHLHNRIDSSKKTNNHFSELC